MPTMIISGTVPHCPRERLPCRAGLPRRQSVSKKPLKVYSFFYAAVKGVFQIVKPFFLMRRKRIPSAESFCREQVDDAFSIDKMLRQFCIEMMNMIIKEIKNKREYLPLLLLADEQESMIDLYLDRGTMFVLEESGSVKAECVVTDEGNGMLEIQNLAVEQEFQRNGYGKALIEFIADHFKNQFEVLQVGTGDSPLTVPFYEHCGFTRHHIIPNYIVDHYDHPIFEGGKQLIDKVYLWMKL